MNVTNLVGINRATFNADDGTVRVDIGSRTETLRAELSDDGLLRVHGLFGKYQTGTKQWPADVCLLRDPRTGKDWVRAYFGFDSHSGRHRQASVFFNSGNP